MTSRAIIAILSLLIPVLAFAQEGKVSGNYNVQQSIEIGGHITDVNGSQNVYNTFVNVQDGFRLLDYTLQMRSLNHTGNLVDNLYFTNNGFGGDPNNVSRLRFSKNKWYDFSGSFRRDVNFFDYNLFGNPFNPANSIVPNSDSAHAMNTRRKMGDFMLTIAPQSPLRLRLGYSRNINEGPALSSNHEGTDVVLFSDYRNRSDRYQVGADWKFAPRTQLSFDQYYEHAKVDTNWTDAPFKKFVSINPATGQPVPVDLGAIYYPYYNQPCTNTPVPILSNGNQVKPQCGIYQNYSRFGPTRTNTPTSQLSFTSNFWKKLDLNLQGSYSSAEMNMKQYNESAQVFVTRTNELAYQFTGPARAKRIAGNAGGGFTYHFNEQWSFSNQTSWTNWRIPGVWASAETACFSSLASATGTMFTAPGRAGSASCLGLATAATPAVYGNSSGADQALETFNRYLGEKSLYNTSTVEWDPSTRFGMHVGYRYGHRELNDKIQDFGSSIFFPTGGTTPRGACTPDQVNCTVTVAPGTNISTVAFGPQDDFGNEELTEHTGMIGFRAVPVDGWRVNADLELMSATNSFTQITPRNAAHFKLRSTYKVAKWGSISGSINALEQRRPAIDETIFPTGVTIPKHKDHARSYNLGFNINPKDWIGVDFGWSLFDVYSMTGTCMPLTSGAPVQGGTPTPCTGLNNTNLPVVLKYTNFTNSGFANIMVKPVKRVTLMVGYDVTSDSGANDWLRADTLAPFRVGVTAAGDVVRPGFGTVAGFVDGPNPFQPLGPLAINYHKPSGSVAIDLYKGLTLKAAFEHYGYNEKSQPLGASFNSSTGLWNGAVPRDFHANVSTLSMRYAF